jgi:E3 ubiquitin-protein ligase DOA10
LTGRKNKHEKSRRKVDGKKKFKDDLEESKNEKEIIDNEPAVTKMDQEVDREDENIDKPMCKFCWSEDTTYENPLLSTCKCKGGVQFIHYSCLK